MPCTCKCRTTAIACQRVTLNPVFRQVLHYYRGATSVASGTAHKAK